MRPAKMALIECHQRVDTCDKVHSPRSVEDWICILDQCRFWKCHAVRSIAEEQLKLAPMNDVLRIAVWRKYGLEKSQLIPCYQALGTRELPLTIEEGHMLEVETAVKVAALREEVLQGMMNHMQHTTTAGCDLRVKELICRASLGDVIDT